MGMECYLVRIAIRNSDIQSVITFAEGQFGLISDLEQNPLRGNDLYFVYRDGHHVIEYEFALRDSASQISMRFALCNPPSIDRILIQQMTSLLDHFDGTATLCDER